MPRLIVLIFSCLVLAGASCEPADSCDFSVSSLDNPYHATGSQTLAASVDRQFVVTANVTEDSVSLVRADDFSLVGTLDVGSEPERVVALGNDFVVSLRGERGLAQMRVVDGQLKQIRKVSTGAEPIGLVASEDGTKLFVAVSQSQVVEERDGSTLEVIRRFAVDHEPRWLALHPSGQTLYVATGMGGRLVVVDLLDGSSSEHGLPQIDTFPDFENPNPGAGGPRSIRITGDPAVRTNGSALLVPTLYVDNINVVGDSGEQEDMPNNDEGYGSSGAGQRFIPAIATVPLDKTGKPKGPGQLQTLEVRDQGGSNTVRGGYITSVTVHPNQPVAFATMETSSTVVAFDLGADQTRCVFGQTGSSDNHDAPRIGLAEARMPEPDGMHIPQALRRGIHSTGGPAGVVITQDNAILVHGRRAQSLSQIQTGSIRDQLHRHSGEMHPRGNEGTSILKVADAQFNASLQQGYNLFYSSTTPSMSGHGVNVSCSTCHFDGRNDGLTWQFTDGPRQTPSLAGQVSATEPVTWQDDVATVTAEVILTSQGRMGGDGLSQADAATVSHFIDWRRHVDLPNKGASNAIIEEGRDIFFSEETGCGTCHTGDHYTDAGLHTIRGQRMRTPTLVGVAASAPYFHDGSSTTLEEVLLRSRDGSMGQTGHLSDAQLLALEAFLTSL